VRHPGNHRDESLMNPGRGYPLIKLGFILLSFIDLT
jgi:hypothetical protein